MIDNSRIPTKTVQISLKVRKEDKALPAPLSCMFNMHSFKGMIPNELGAKPVPSSNLSLLLMYWLCSQVVWMQVQHPEFLGSLQMLFLPENILLPTAGAPIYKAEVTMLIKGLLTYATRTRKNNSQHCCSFLSEFFLLLQDLCSNSSTVPHCLQCTYQLSIL